MVGQRGEGGGGGGGHCEEDVKKVDGWQDDQLSSKMELDKQQLLLTIEDADASRTR